jgi:hypothetical protein
MTRSRGKKFRDYTQETILILGTMTLSVMNLIVTLSIMDLIVIFSIMDLIVIKSIMDLIVTL